MEAEDAGKSHLTLRPDSPSSLAIKDRHVNGGTACSSSRSTDFVSKKGKRMFNPYNEDSGKTDHLIWKSVGGKGVQRSIFVSAR